MSRFLTAAVVLVCLTSDVLPQARGEPPLVGSQPVAGRTDRYGDPLPAGALARLGTVRFRHAGAFLVAYAPDGKTLLSVGGGTFRRWDLPTGKELERRPTCSGVIPCAALTADGKFLALAGDEVICLYDVRTGVEVRRLDVHQDCPVHSLAFSADGELLASKPPFAATVTLWELRTGKKRREFKPPEDDEADFGSGVILAEDSVAFSPDGKYLAVGSEDGILRLWQVATGKAIRRGKWPAHRRSCVAFSPDGKLLAWQADDDEGIRLAEAGSGRQWRRLKGVEGSLLHLAFSPDGRTLASVHDGSGREVRLWDVATGKVLCRLEGDLYGIHAVAFSPDGKTLAGGMRCRIRQWDAATGKELLAPGGTQGIVCGVALSPDGKTLAATDDSGAIRLWEAATGKQLQQFGEAAYGRLVFSPDGKTLAWSGNDDTIRLADVGTGKKVRDFLVPQSANGALAYSAEGATLALGRFDGCVLLEAATGKAVHRFHPSLPDKPPSFLAFAADGTVLVLHQGPVVLAWDTATGRQYPPCRLAPEEEAEAATLSPDGKTLALWVFRRQMRGGRRLGVVKDSGILVLQEVVTGRERGRCRGGDALAADPVSAALAFSSDGRTLAVLSADRIHLWDVVAGKEVGRLQTGQDELRCLAFAADGRTLASAGLDTTVLLWDLGTLRKPDRLARRRPPGPGEMEALWSDLAAEDAARAYRAIGALAATPAAVPFLADRLREQARAEAERRQRLPHLLADLDSEEFTVRRSAAAELEGLADLPEPLLRRALASKPSPEFRRRAEWLLEKREGAAPSSETLRGLRAVEALERLATPEARQALQTLGKGAPESRLTQEAKASLERLARRSAAPR